ncbi:MAG: diacylglycerol kinase family protein [Patescibacteria group bacterium]
MFNRFIKSFQYAIQGFSYLFKEEENFYLQTLGAAVAIGAGWILGISRDDWIFVGLAITLVLGSEILNTILEDISDEIEPNHHPVVGKIKDMMAAFVLLSSLTALLIACLVFIPRIL